MKKTTFFTILFLFIPMFFAFSGGSISYKLGNVEEGKSVEYIVENTTKKPVNWFELKVFYSDPLGASTMSRLGEEMNKRITIISYIIERRLEPTGKITVKITNDTSANQKVDNTVIIVEREGMDKLLRMVGKIDTFGEGELPKWLFDGKGIYHKYIPLDEKGHSWIVEQNILKVKHIK
jgi:hypothetical protein